VLHADLRSIPRVRAVAEFLQRVVEAEQDALYGPGRMEDEALPVARTG